MTPALYAACATAVHIVTADGTILRAGRACLFVMDQLGWHLAAGFLARPPLLWVVERGYAVVARHRPFFARFLLRH